MIDNPKHTAAMCGATYTVILVKSRHARHFTWKYVIKPALRFVYTTIRDAIKLTAEGIYTIVDESIYRFKQSRRNRFVWVGNARMHIEIARLQPLRPDTYDVSTWRRTPVMIHKFSEERVLQAMRDLANIIGWEAVPYETEGKPAFKKTYDGRTFVFDAPFPPDETALKITLQRANIQIHPMNMRHWRDTFQANCRYVIEIDDKDFRKQLELEAGRRHIDLTESELTVFDQDEPETEPRQVGERPTATPLPYSTASTKLSPYRLVDQLINQDNQPNQPAVDHDFEAHLWPVEPDLKGLDRIAHYLDVVPRVGDTPGRFGLTNKEIADLVGVTPQGCQKNLKKHLERGNIVREGDEYARPF